MERLKVFIICCLILCNAALMAQSPYGLVLGIAQDGGYPQAGCSKSCCKDVWKQPEVGGHQVASLAIIDPLTHQSWIVDATPDFPKQLQRLRIHLNDPTHMPSGIILTHAHIGHYSGLMHLGREVMGTSGIPVYVMPRMRRFLESNGPWSQLVKLNNISLQSLKADSLIALNDHIQFIPVQVPHRDEFSETIGCMLRLKDAHSDVPPVELAPGQMMQQTLTKPRQLLYIPDIDAWEKWFPQQTAMRMQQLFSECDHVLIDGTFMNGKELGQTRMKEVPHPFIDDSQQLMSGFPEPLKRKISFIHLNHSNPMMRLLRGADHWLYAGGYGFPEEGAELR